jgi:hypothetical protein
LAKVLRALSVHANVPAAAGKAVGSSAVGAVVVVGVFSAAADVEIDIPEPLRSVLAAVFGARITVITAAALVTPTPDNTAVVSSLLHAGEAHVFRLASDYAEDAATPSAASRARAAPRTLRRSATCS